MGWFVRVLYELIGMCIVVFRISCELLCQFWCIFFYDIKIINSGVRWKDLDLH